jgi:DNA-binding MarR family transcriptional regulator
LKIHNQNAPISEILLTKQKYVYILLIMKERSNSTEYERVARLGPVCICNNLRRAARLVTNYYDKLFESTGLRVSQLTILVALYRAGIQTINEMAEKLELDRTTLTRNLKPLAHKGLLTIAPGSDQRTRVVALTPAGEAVLIKALPLWEQAQSYMVEGIGEANAALLLAQLSEAAALVQSD